MTARTNTDLLNEHDDRPAPVTKRATNASFLSSLHANITDLARPSSLLRETRGTGLGGQDRKPRPTIERK